jgi:two-component system, NtrC family, response regulator AtoC
MADSSPQLLLVDDDAAVTKVLASLLKQENMQALEARSGDEALRLLEKHAIDAVISDLRMPGMDGMTLLGRVNRSWPDIPIVLLTAHGSISLAVEAMKAGAADFMVKPFDREEVLFVVKKVLAASGASSSTERPMLDGRSLLGQSAAMNGVREMVRRAAAGNATVLIRGETGTGKELVARAVHEQSPRRTKPFVKLNCAALPDSLLESELFGHEKGAFTGAVGRKPGRIEIAHEGTLFLDEIGDVPRSTQVKLLRVLQEREIERVGGSDTIKVDVRFVAATHRNLEARIAEGLFREDFFYRLNVVPIDVPPLRERREDLRELIRHFAMSAAKNNGKPPEDLDEAASTLLASQPWPGNVRQLENFIERLVVLADGPIVRRTDVERELKREADREKSARPALAADARNTGALDEQRREAERDAVVDALQRAIIARSLAARILGVSRRTLYNKLDELGLGEAS